MVSYRATSRDWFFPLLLLGILSLSTCDKEHGEVNFTNLFDPDNPSTHGDPYNLRVKATSNGVLVQWNEIANVDGVTVYRSTSPNGGFEKIGTSTSREYVDKDVQPGKIYYYQLRAYHDGMEGPPSSWDGIRVSTVAQTFPDKPFARPDKPFAQLDKIATGNVQFSPDGKLLAVASGGGILLYDANNLLLVARLVDELQTGLLGAVWSISFSPDGRALASGGDNDIIRLWDVASRSLLATLQEHLPTQLGDVRPVWSVSFSPDGRTLASGGWDKTIKLWDAATRSLLVTLQGHTGSVSSISFSPDGRTLASGSWDKTIKLWDVASRFLLATLQEHQGFVDSVSFSPDGRTLASGSWDETIKLWDAATRFLLATLQGHTGSVSSISFSPDGRTLASGGGNEIKLWDVSTRSLLATLGHTSFVKSVSFSPNGRTLASVINDGTVLLWDIMNRP
ncbi:hypothetical protein HYR99_25805 [Candidatus Poribacteria bacterium]|nr:hypothetical protein [Candidatus Poribacteria bacterium]